MTVPTLKLHHPSRLRMTDLSFLSRFGIKGGGAANWLKDHDIVVPKASNTWCALPEGGLIARLGLAEFLIEDSSYSRHVAKLMLACHPLPARVYPFLRQDLAIALSGPAVHDLLRQTCNVNFQALDLTQHPIVLTSMMGVSVTILPELHEGETIYRIWCDGTFGAYVWDTLGAIAAELGGSRLGSRLYGEESVN